MDRSEGGATVQVEEAVYSIWHSCFLFLSLLYCVTADHKGRFCSHHAHKALNFYMADVAFCCGGTPTFWFIIHFNNICYRNCDQN